MLALEILDRVPFGGVCNLQRAGGAGGAQLTSGRTIAPASELAPISVLKPLAGVDEGLEAEPAQLLRPRSIRSSSFCSPSATRTIPPCHVVEALQREFPALPSRLMVTGEPPYPNAKVFSLDRMLAEARYDLLVMSDSDIRVAPGFLESIAARVCGSAHRASHLPIPCRSRA